ncbi:MAG: oligosaccharide flippase family protein [Planctomycetota bacterium]
MIPSSAESLGPPPHSVSNASADRLGGLSRLLSRCQQHLAAFGLLGFAFASQLGFQLIYFFILTRMLGPHVFGQYASVLATINLVSPVVGLGFAELSVLRVSQNREHAGIWAANTLAVHFVLGLVFAAAFGSLAWWLAFDGWLAPSLVFGISFLELVLLRACLALGRVHQGRGEMGQTSLIYSGVAALKAAIALGIFICGLRSLSALVVVSVMCFVPVTAWLAHRLCKNATPSARPSLRLLWRNARSGLGFAGGTAGRAAYAEVDKLFLAVWTASQTVGTYVAGHKILTIAVMPVWAVLEATFPRQVQLAGDDPKSCRKFTRNLLWINLAIAFPIAVLIYQTAPLLVWILGQDYANSASVLQWGCLLPVLQAFQFTLGGYLAATGRQETRAVLQVVGLVVLIAGLAATIPQYSWRGVIVVSIACEGLTGLLFAMGAWMTRPKLSASDQTSIRETEA